jgi:hypothetical protein
MQMILALVAAAAGAATHGLSTLLWQRQHLDLRAYFAASMFASIYMVDYQPTRTSHD